MPKKGSKNKVRPDNSTSQHASLMQNLGQVIFAQTYPRPTQKEAQELLSKNKDIRFLLEDLGGGKSPRYKISIQNVKNRPGKDEFKYVGQSKKSEHRKKLAEDLATQLNLGEAKKAKTSSSGVRYGGRNDETIDLYLQDARQVDLFVAQFINLAFDEKDKGKESKLLNILAPLENKDVLKLLYRNNKLDLPKNSPLEERVIGALYLDAIKNNDVSMVETLFKRHGAEKMFNIRVNIAENNVVGPISYDAMSAAVAFNSSDIAQFLISKAKEYYLPKDQGLYLKVLYSGIDQANLRGNEQALNFFLNDARAIEGCEKYLLNFAIINRNTSMVKAFLKNNSNEYILLNDSYFYPNKFTKSPEPINKAISLAIAMNAKDITKFLLDTEAKYYVNFPEYKVFLESLINGANHFGSIDTMTVLQQELAGAMAEHGKEAARVVEEELRRREAQERADYAKYEQDVYAEINRQDAKDKETANVRFGPPPTDWGTNSGANNKAKAKKGPFPTENDWGTGRYSPENGTTPPEFRSTDTTRSGDSTPSSSGYSTPKRQDESFYIPDDLRARNEARRAKMGGRKQEDPMAELLRKTKAKQAELDERLRREQEKQRKTQSTHSSQSFNAHSHSSAGSKTMDDFLEKLRKKDEQFKREQEEREKRGRQQQEQGAPFTFHGGTQSASPPRPPQYSSSTPSPSFKPTSAFKGVAESSNWKENGDFIKTVEVFKREMLQTKQVMDQRPKLKERLKPQLLGQIGAVINACYNGKPTGGGKTQTEPIRAEPGWLKDKDNEEMMILCCKAAGVEYNKLIEKEEGSIDIGR